jgi:hypothetical protein|tara:strand:- start:5179 stop:5394 length:216 start_codon:yes stop_codon:yes gene_type:complete
MPDCYPSHRFSAIRRIENINAAVTTNAKQMILARKNCSIMMASTSKIKIADPTKVSVANSARKTVRKELFL